MGSRCSLINDAHCFKANNICNFVDRWTRLSGDPWIHSVVTGVRIPFWKELVQLRQPFPFRLSELERAAVVGELQKLSQKQVIERVTPVEGQFISNVFLRPKRDGQFRMILDLTELNKAVQYEHFKMTSLRTALEMMRPDCWMASVDLKDAYYSVAVAEEDRKFLRLQWEGQLYQFRALPNGLACAPRIFTKLLSPVYAGLRQEGHECFPYIDDSFVVGDSREECKATVGELASTLDHLGFFVHREKSVMVPTQRLTFLGFELDSRDMSVSLTQEKKEKFVRAAEDVLNKELSSVREVAGLVGLMIAYSPALEYGGAHIKALERDKNLGLKLNKGNFDGRMAITEEAKVEIHWWLDQIGKEDAKRQIRWDASDVEVITDASMEGWGAHRGEALAGGRWLPGEAESHINVLELKAILLGLKSLVKEEGEHISILTDNTTALAYVKNMGGLRSEECNAVAKEIWDWAEQSENWLSIAHIPGVDNCVADYLSRHFSDRIEWSINMKIFKKICKVFGQPTVDLFASRTNAKVDKYVAWGPDPEAWRIDAFVMCWTNEFFYVFPPFSLVGRVIRKLRADGGKAILVAPDWPTQPWYGSLMNATRRRLHFRRANDNLLTLGRPRALENVNRIPLVACLFLG